MHAIRQNKLKMVKYLIEELKVDYKFGFLQDPLRIAAQKGYTDIVRYLLTLPEIDPTAFYFWAGKEALKKGHMEVVDLLLKDGRTTMQDIQE